jgi:hypothetical protein
LAAGGAVSLARQHRKGVGEHAHRTALVGIRDGAAGNLADVEMIMMLDIGVKRDFKPAQGVDMAQLHEDQRRQMIPALEVLVVGVCVVALHDRAKLPAIDRFEQIRKDAIEVAHARPF